MLDSPATRAWVDESGSNATADPCTYLLAAAILQVDHEDEARSTMARLKVPGAPKLHWSDDRPRRPQIAAVIAGLPLAAVVVVRSTPELLPHDPERARRKCIERLLWELTARGVAEVTFESRGPKDDQKDRAMLDALRRSRALAAPIRLEHRIGRAEPLLWVPDAICGAVVEARCGNDEHLVTLERVTDVVSCAP